MVTEKNTIEMAPVSLGLTSDTQHLMKPNESNSSFISENNEITITRWLDHRKYSMMSFKPCAQKNVVDIVVTKGECNEGRKTLLLHEIGSRDIRAKYSTKAKAALSFVIFLLLVMIGIVVFAMAFQPWKHRADYSATTVLVASENFQSNNVTIGSAGNFTYT